MQELSFLYSAFPLVFLSCLFVAISGDTPFYADSLVGTYGEYMHCTLSRTSIFMLWLVLILIELEFAYNRCMTVF